MPMIDLTFVRGSLDDRAMSRLTDELVDSVIARRTCPGHSVSARQHLGVPARAGTSELSVGGRGPGAPRFRVDVSAFDGALSQDRKERLADDVHAAVCAAAGIEPGAQDRFMSGR